LTINESITQSPFAPAGGFVVTTNITTKTIATNTVAGEFLILPTNACEVVILGPQLTFTNAYANILAFVQTNVPVSNAVLVTNITVTYTEALIDYSTNHAFLALPISCLQTNPVIAGGIERVRFERRDFDSLIGRFFDPFTNRYSLNIVTNNTLSSMRVFRSVVAPDILFSATDAPFTPGPGADPTTLTIGGRTITFGTNATGTYYPGAAGPGTVVGPTSIAFNKAGPTYLNLSPNAYFWWSAEASQQPILIWGSFDGTTNPPVIYPNRTSLQSLEDGLFIQISPPLLAEGFVGQPYPATSFSATGGHDPYTWKLAPGSPGLPPGLTLTTQGVLSKTPTQRATFDFVIRMTDATGRFVDRQYSIKINW
jgi:hypothetical protein